MFDSLKIKVVRTDQVDAQITTQCNVVVMKGSKRVINKSGKQRKRRKFQGPIPFIFSWSWQMVNIISIIGNTNQIGLRYVVPVFWLRADFQTSTLIHHLEHTSCIMLFGLRIPFLFVPQMSAKSDNTENLNINDLLMD
ncbi:MAG: hypothetical protein EZS28_003001 [Streblomastix strix]|uniref:Uncharacterized protein n=1 Tax=Streblomastix strix TaxID=222440 RepID=A0A5J4X297_9EUKA|nr:MAG: hypothetical protein EZS28_003001 [Streblomastix strix]